MTNLVADLKNLSENVDSKIKEKSKEVFYN
jgi:hypothetical protein